MICQFHDLFILLRGKETRWPMNGNLNVLQSLSLAANRTVFLCSAHSSGTVLTELLMSFYVYVEMSGQRARELESSKM